jgi:hypothetical protein
VIFDLNIARVSELVRKPIYFIVIARSLVIYRLIMSRFRNTSLYRKYITIKFFTIEQ